MLYNVLAVEGTAALPDVALRRRLEWRAATMLIDELRPEPIGELLELDGNDAHPSPVLDRARTLLELRARIKRNLKLSRLGKEDLQNPKLATGPMREKSYMKFYDDMRIARPSSGCLRYRSSAPASDMAA